MISQYTDEIRYVVCDQATKETCRVIVTIYVLSTGTVLVVAEPPLAIHYQTERFCLQPPDDNWAGTHHHANDDILRDPFTMQLLGQLPLDIAIIRMVIGEDVDATIMTVIFLLPIGYATLLTTFVLWYFLHGMRHHRSSVCFISCQ
jgi:hypothetical protein